MASLTGDHARVIIEIDQGRSTTLKKNLQDGILKFKASTSIVVYLNIILYITIYDSPVFS